MQIDLDNLSDKQVKFIDEYFRCNSVNDVCKNCGISKQTYYTYLKDTNIKRVINKMRVEILEDTSRFLQSNLKYCSDELMRIIKDNSTLPQIKINAINSVFNNSYKLTEQVDISTKLNDLEDKIEEQGLK